MYDSQELSYENRRLIVQYLPFYTRLEVAKHIPATRSAHLIAPFNFEQVGIVRQSENKYCIEVGDRTWKRDIENADTLRHLFRHYLARAGSRFSFLRLDELDRDFEMFIPQNLREIKLTFAPELTKVDELLRIWLDKLKRSSARKFRVVLDDNLTDVAIIEDVATFNITKCFDLELFASLRVGSPFLRCPIKKLKISGGPSTLEQFRDFCVKFKEQHHKSGSYYCGCVEYREELQMATFFESLKTTLCAEEYNGSLYVNSIANDEAELHISWSPSSVVSREAIVIVSVLKKGEMDELKRVRELRRLAAEADLRKSRIVSKVLFQAGQNWESVGRSRRSAINVYATCIANGETKLEISHYHLERGLVQTQVLVRVLAERKQRRPAEESGNFSILLKICASKTASTPIWCFRLPTANMQHYVAFYLDKENTRISALEITNCDRDVGMRVPHSLDHVTLLFTVDLTQVDVALRMWVEKLRNSKIRKLSVLMSDKLVDVTILERLATFNLTDSLTLFTDVPLRTDSPFLKCSIKTLSICEYDSSEEKFRAFCVKFKSANHEIQSYYRGYVHFHDELHIGAFFDSLRATLCAEDLDGNLYVTSMANRETELEIVHYEACDSLRTVVLLTVLKKGELVEVKRQKELSRRAEESRVVSILQEIATLLLIPCFLSFLVIRFFFEILP
ncbi:unnamed protein product [Caenorhabditis sp. 36 PRJEB53466]|nr:unnamed protein product [Caenorhabditis sp. 36 PRJEB53466]